MKNKELGLSHFRVPANSQDAEEDVDLCAQNTVDETLNQVVNSRQANLSKVTAFVSDIVFKLSIGALNSFSRRFAATLIGAPPGFCRNFSFCWPFIGNADKDAPESVVEARGRGSSHIEKHGVLVLPFRG